MSSTQRHKKAAEDQVKREILNFLGTEQKSVQEIFDHLESTLLPPSSMVSCILEDLKKNQVIEQERANGCSMYHRTKGVSKFDKDAADEPLQDILLKLVDWPANLDRVMRDIGNGHGYSQTCVRNTIRDMVKQAKLDQFAEDNYCIWHASHEAKTRRNLKAVAEGLLSYHPFNLKSVETMYRLVSKKVAQASRKDFSLIVDSLCKQGALYVYHRNGRKHYTSAQGTLPTDFYVSMLNASPTSTINPHDVAAEIMKLDFPDRTDTAAIHNMLRAKGVNPTLRTLNMALGLLHAHNKISGTDDNFMSVWSKVQTVADLKPYTTVSVIDALLTMDTEPWATLDHYVFRLKNDGFAVTNLQVLNVLRHLVALRWAKSKDVDEEQYWLIFKSTSTAPKLPVVGDIAERIMELDIPSDGMSTLEIQHRLRKFATGVPLYSKVREALLWLRGEGSIILTVQDDCDVWIKWTKADQKSEKDNTVCVQIYLDNGIIFEYDVPFQKAAREHADAIIKTGYRHTDNETGVMEHFPPHRITKVKCVNNMSTKYPDRVRGT